MQEDNLDEIFDGIQSTNQNKTPKSFIGDYAVLELLGSGGFGSVYKVKKKKSGQSFLAMKEVGIILSLCVGTSLILPSNTPMIE